MDDVIFFTHWPYSASCILLSGDRTRSTNTANSRDYNQTLKKLKVLIVSCAPGAKSGVYECLVALVFDLKHSITDGSFFDWSRKIIRVINFLSQLVERTVQHSQLMHASAYTLAMRMALHS